LESARSLQCLIFNMDGIKLCVDGDQVEKITGAPEKDSIVRLLDEALNCSRQTSVGQKAVYLKLKNAENTFVEAWGLENLETISVGKILPFPGILEGVLSDSPIRAAAMFGSEVLLLVDMERVGGNFHHPAL